MREHFQRKGKSLPKVLFNIIVKDGFLLPAEVFQGLADELLFLGSDGTLAAVVFVVALAGKDIDKMVLDGTLQTARHVIIHSAQADRHTDGFIVTILRAIGTLRLWVSEVDASNGDKTIWDIVLQDVAQTIFSDGTVLAVAYNIASCLFTKDFFSGGLGGILFCHTDIWFVEAKLIKMLGLEKFLETNYQILYSFLHSIAYYLILNELYNV